MTTLNIVGQTAVNGCRIQVGPAFTPASLFTASEQGAWYDPSDLSTLYQDSAGTTAVTTVEQPVGYIADKSGNGNHATQATSAARPALRNRYNLLTFSEQFDNAAWTKSAILAFGSGSVANATTAPDGTTTADLLVPDTTTAVHTVRTATLTIGKAFTQSVYVKAAGYTKVALRESVGGLDSASFELTGAGILLDSVGLGSAATITSVGDGWYRLSLDCSATSGRWTCYILDPSYTTGAVTATWTPNGTDGIYVWGAQIVTANDNTAIQGQYQRIAAAPTIGSAPTYDDDLTKFPPYLAFDGSDDSMATASIDFSATDEMSVFAGLTKLSDAATGVLVELSAIFENNNGAFRLSAPSQTGANSYRYSSKGTVEVNAGTGVFAAAADTAVISGLSDISGDTATLRRNGAVVVTVATDQGTGNFGNYPLYIGSRAGTSIRFNGRLYGLIVRGKQTIDSDIEATEAYLATKTGIAL